MADHIDGGRSVALHSSGTSPTVAGATLRGLSVVIPHQISMCRRTPSLDALVHSMWSSKTRCRGALVAEVTGGVERAAGGCGCAQADATTASTSDRLIAE
jgi:hypothetical protein